MLITRIEYDNRETKEQQDLSHTMIHVQAPTKALA